jgi:signal transduction histidine kinase
MDAPIVINGQLVGIICCEDTAERNWNGEDLLFASAACDILTISLKAMQHKAYIAEIESKNITLQDQAEEITQMNEELLHVNETLEERVAKRTQELETQNKQLSEYAFINSHLLRSPLSSILGLINLLNNSELSEKERELVQHLHNSGTRLDEVIHRISESLGKGNLINRDDITAKDVADGKAKEQRM